MTRSFFPCAHWPFLRLLWRGVYADTLLILYEVVGLFTESEEFPFYAGTRLSPDSSRARILSRAVGRLPFLGGGVGSTQEVSVLAKSSGWDVPFSACASASEGHFLTPFPRPRRWTHIFPPKKFMGLALILRSVTHCD